MQAVNGYSGAAPAATGARCHMGTHGRSPLIVGRDHAPAEGRPCCQEDMKPYARKGTTTILLKGVLCCARRAPAFGRKPAGSLRPLVQSACSGALGYGRLPALPCVLSWSPGISGASEV
jgi:hypothetical protein